jgi:Zn-dependent peptidase ImmA (M78 family)
MSECPDEITVLGKPWQLINNNEYCEAEEVYGLTDCRECVIYYTTDTTPSQIRDTVLHELIHALDLSLHLELTEQQVHAIAAALYGTFMGNPKFTQWLLGRIINKGEDS